MYRVYLFLMYIYGIFMDGLKETGKVYHCAGNVLDLMYGYDDELLELEQEIMPLPLAIPVIEKYEDKGRAKFLLMQERDGQTQGQQGQTQGQQDGQTQGQQQQQNDDHLFVMEMTPVGNVIMQYDGKKESFVYYSDNIVPFRFLETVSRKYMTTFNKTFLCASNHQKPPTDKKPSQKQPMTTKELMNQTKNPVLKRKELIEVVMNRYSNAGRFSNFKMLQPVAKHITDKKRLLSFRDFKCAGIKK